MKDFGLLWLRVLMGAGIAFHGYGKIFTGKMEGFTQGVAKMSLPLLSPEIAAWIAAFSEFAGGILIIFGLATRVSAFFVFSTMSVAAFIAHAQDPFAAKELAFAYWTMAGALMFTGAGNLSLDSKLM